MTVHTSLLQFKTFLSHGQLLLGTLEGDSSPSKANSVLLTFQHSVLSYTWNINVKKFLTVTRTSTADQRVERNRRWSSANISASCRAFLLTTRKRCACALATQRRGRCPQLNYKHSPWFEMNVPLCNRGSLCNYSDSYDTLSSRKVSSCILHLTWRNNRQCLLEGVAHSSITIRLSKEIMSHDNSRSYVTL